MRQTRTLLVALLFAAFLLTGMAFTFTFNSTLAWQQRDAVSAEQVGVSVADGEFTVRVRVTNPLDRAIVVRDVELVVFEGSPPFGENAELSVRREAELADGEVRVPAGETVTVVVRTPMTDAERARQAAEDGTATPSGLFYVEMVDREFLVEVGPNG